jgi:hypothetical protein
MEEVDMRRRRKLLCALGREEGRRYGGLVGALYLLGEVGSRERVRE